MECVSMMAQDAWQYAPYIRSGQAKKSRLTGGFFSDFVQPSDRNNVFRLRAFLTIGDSHSDFLAFVQRFTT